MIKEQGNCEKTSNFYFACRSNEVETVIKLLDELPLETLDRIEPNESTALHAACFYGHIDVVRLLLERGFTRRTRNLYDQTPCEEAEHYPDIQKLFLRSKHWNRFGGDVTYDVERLKWIIIYNNENPVVLDPIPEIYQGNRLTCRTFHSDKILEQLTEMPKNDVIRRLFQRAVEEKDCTRLIQAYTTETEFADRINDYLIKRRQRTQNNETHPSDVLMQFVDTIYYNMSLHTKYQFIGKCYRSIKVRSDRDLSMYEVGKKIINQTFISVTKDRDFAENYVRCRTSSGRYAAMICFEIRVSKTALSIETLSEFPDEKEVLIMPNRIFKIVQVTMKNNFDAEIKLCESTSTKVDVSEPSGGLLGFFQKKKINCAD